MSNTSLDNEKTQYSKILSSLFCSYAIIALSILSLLNNRSLDIYSLMALLKVVVPAAVSFWFLGFATGKILDSYDKNKTIKLNIPNDIDEEKAYEIPSMFADPSANDNMEDITE